jgi:DNA-binding transcriptional ArsR family regulator
MRLHFKYSEIAEILDISIKTVEYHMRRALTFLRKHLLRFFMFFFIRVNGESSVLLYEGKKEQREKENVKQARLEFVS